jgi:hypothetical protein
MSEPKIDAYTSALSGSGATAHAPSFEPCGKCRKPWLCAEKGCMDKAASEPAPMPPKPMTEAEVVALARSIGEWRDPITADRLTRIVNAARGVAAIAAATGSQP